MSALACWKTDAKSETRRVVLGSGGPGLALVRADEAALSNRPSISSNSLPNPSVRD
jgi:hypothetical protein